MGSTCVQLGCNWAATGDPGGLGGPGGPGGPGGLCDPGHLVDRFSASLRK